MWIFNYFFTAAEEIIVIVSCGCVIISSLFSFDGICQIKFYAVRLKKRILYKEKSNFSIVCAGKKAFWFYLFLRIYDIFSTGWKPDQAKFICSMLCLKRFSNIFAKFTPKEQINELWAEVSYTLVYFCWEEVCICFYLAVFTVTVLLFLHSNYWCLHSLQRNPLCDWQTSTSDRLSMRTAGLNSIRKTVKNLRELTSGIFSFS